MIVTVLDVTPGDDRQVRVSTDLGGDAVPAVWMGEWPPAVGREYPVELTIPDDRPSAVDAVPVPGDHPPILEFVGNRYRLVARVDVAFEDRVVALDFGTGTVLVDLGSALREGALPRGAVIEVRFDALELHPYDL